MVEGGGDLPTLKWHGGWKSSSDSKGYIEEFTAKKVVVSKKKKHTQRCKHVLHYNTKSTNPLPTPSKYKFSGKTERTAQPHELDYWRWYFFTKKSKFRTSSSAKWSKSNFQIITLILSIFM